MSSFGLFCLPIGIRFVFCYHSWGADKGETFGARNKGSASRLSSTARYSIISGDAEIIGATQIQSIGDVGEEVNEFSVAKAGYTTKILPTERTERKKRRRSDNASGEMRNVQILPVEITSRYALQLSAQFRFVQKTIILPPISGGRFYLLLGRCVLKPKFTISTGAF